MNPKDFPTSEQITKSIENFKRMQWPTYDPTSSLPEYLNTLSNNFFSDLTILPDIIQSYSASQFPFRLFRTRKIDEFRNINFIGEHSYCPIPLSNSMGRCHFPGFPVFYCSNSPKVALLETTKEKDFEKAKYCISVWETIKTDERIIIQPYLFGNLHPDNDFKAWKDELNNKINEPFDNQLTTDQIEGLRKLFGFMADLFLQDHEYSMSAFIAHRRIYAPHELKTDILIYPSVQTQYQGVNMAISPNFVDRCLTPTRFYIVEVTDINKEEWVMRFNCTAYGTLNNHQILWKKVTPDDDDYQQYFKKDFNFNGEFDFTEMTP